MADKLVIKELTQRKLFHLRQFKLYNDRLYYRNKHLFGSLQIEVPFEELTNQVVYEKTSKPILWLFTALFTIVFITRSYYMFVEPDFDFGVYFIVIVLLSISYLGAYFGQRDVMIIRAESPKYIEFDSKRPDENSVTDFYMQLRKTSKNFLLDKYVYEKTLSLVQQKTNLSALQDRKMIDEVDFKIISDKISFDSISKPLGFKITSQK